MAKKPRTITPTVVLPSISPKQAIHLLQQQVERGKELLANRPITSAAEAGWETVAQDILTRAFGSDSPHIEAVMSIGRYSFYGGSGSELEAHPIDQATAIECAQFGDRKRSSCSSPFRCLSKSWVIRRTYGSDWCDRRRSRYLDWRVTSIRLPCLGRSWSTSAGA